jgi:hypothetical protein
MNRIKSGRYIPKHSGYNEFSEKWLKGISSNYNELIDSYEAGEN